MTERPIPFSGPMVRAILDGRKTQTRRVIQPQPEPFVQNSPDRHELRHPAPYIDSYCSEKTTAANPRGMSVNWCWWTRDDRCGETVARCPYGVPGDGLWVREGWQVNLAYDRFDAPTIWIASGGDMEECVHYPADGSAPAWAGRKRIPRLMPRWASRLTLEVTDVRVQRLQDITEEDARAEGATLVPGVKLATEVADLWRFDYGPEGRGDHAMAKFARPCFESAWESINGQRAPWASNPWVWAITFRRAA